MRAIAADIAVDAPLPVVDLNDIAAVADAVLAAAQPIAEVLADLDATPAGPRLARGRGGEPALTPGR